MDGWNTSFREGIRCLPTSDYCITGSQDAYIQDTPLDLAAVDELLQENEYLGNQILVDSMFMSIF